MSEHHKKRTRAVEGVDHVRRSRPAQQTHELRQAREPGGPDKGRDSKGAEGARRPDGPAENRRADEPRRQGVRPNDAFEKSQDLVDEESSRRGSGRNEEHDVSKTLLQGLLGREAAERRAREGREEGPTLLRSRREPKQPETKPRLFGANGDAATAAGSPQALRAQETRDPRRPEGPQAQQQPQPGQPPSAPGADRPQDPQANQRPQPQGQGAQPQPSAAQRAQGPQPPGAQPPQGQGAQPQPSAAQRAQGPQPSGAQPRVAGQPQPSAARRAQGPQPPGVQPQGAAQLRQADRAERPDRPQAAADAPKTRKTRDLSPGKDLELPKAPGLVGAERKQVDRWFDNLSRADQKWYAKYVSKQPKENREEALSFARRIDDQAVKNPKERRELRGRVLDQLMRSELRPEQQRHLGKIVLTDENPTRKQQALERNGFGTKPGEAAQAAPGTKPGETLEQLTNRPGAFNTNNNSLFLSTALLEKNGPKETLRETVRHELGHLRADEALTGNAPQSRDQQLHFGLELNRNYQAKVATPEARAQAQQQLTNLYRPHTSSPQEAREKAAHALENRDEYYASLRSLRELNQNNEAGRRAVRQFDPATSGMMRREERGTLRTDEQFLRNTNVDQLSQRYGLPKGELERFRGYQDDPAKRARLETYLTRRAGTTTSEYRQGSFASGGTTVPRERPTTGRNDGSRVTLASYNNTTQRTGDRRVDGNNGTQPVRNDERRPTPRTDRRDGDGPRRVRNDDDDRVTRPTPRPPTGGGNDGGGTTTRPPSGGSNDGGGTTTRPPSGGGNDGGGTTTQPPRPDDSSGTGGSTGGGSSSGSGSTGGSSSSGSSYNSGYNSGYSSGYYDYSSSYSSLGSSFPSSLDSMSFGTLGDFLSQTGMSMSDLQELLPPGMDVANLDLNSDGKITGSDISLLKQLQMQFGNSTSGGDSWTQMSSLLGQISTGHTEAAPGSLAAVFSGAAVRRLAGGTTQEIDGSNPVNQPNPAALVRETGQAPPPTPSGQPGGGGAPGSDGPLSPLRVALFREAHGSLENIVNGRGGAEGLWLVNALAQDRDGRAGVTDAFESMVTSRNGPEKMMSLFQHAASSPDQSVAMATTLRDMAEAAPDRAVGIMLLTMDAQGGTESVSRLFSALTQEPKGAIAFAEFLDVTAKDPNSARGLWEMMDTLSTPAMEDPARGQRLAGSLSRSSEWVQGSQALTRTFGTLLETDDGGTRFATLMNRMSDTPEGARDTGRMLSNLVFDREGGTQVARIMARSTQSRTGARHIAETLDRAASTREGAVAVSRTFLGMSHSRDGARVLANLARDSSTAAPLLSMLQRLEQNPAAASRFSQALDRMAADPRVRTEMNLFRGRAAATPELQAALDRVWRPEAAPAARASAPVPLSWGGALAMERAGLAPRRESTSVTSVSAPSAAPGVTRSIEAPAGAQAGSGAGQQGQGNTGSSGRAPVAPSTVSEPGEAPAPPVVRTAAPVTVTPTVPVLIDWPSEAAESAGAESAPEAAAATATAAGTEGTPTVKAHLPHPIEEPKPAKPAGPSAPADEQKAEAVRRPGDPLLRPEERARETETTSTRETRRVSERATPTASVGEATSAAQASRTGADIPLFARTDAANNDTKPQSTPFRPGDYYSEDTLRSLRICPDCGFRTSSAGVCARCVSAAYREGRTNMAVAGARAI